MSTSNIAVDVSDLRLPVKDGIRAAADMQFRAVELGAATGELAPENLSSSGRRHLARYLQSLGLDLSAITADFPNLRLTEGRGVQERVDRTCDVLQLAKDTGTRIVTAAVGALTHPETGEPSLMAMEALSQIGEFAESRGMVYAVRPSHDSADRLVRVFKNVGCPALRVCLDPAAMVMSGVNPLAVVMKFSDQIALLHARDATTGASDRAGHETALGEGDIDFHALMALLREADFHGPQVLRRTDSSNPQADLEAARELLSRLIQAS